MHLCGDAYCCIEIYLRYKMPFVMKDNGGVGEQVILKMSTLNTMDLCQNEESKFVTYSQPIFTVLFFNLS